MNIHESILVKLLMIITVVVTSVILCAVIITALEQQRFVQQVYEDKVVSLAQSLDAAIISGDLDDPVTLQTRLYKFILLNPDVLRVSLNKARGDSLVTVASTDTDAVGKLASPMNLVSLQQRKPIHKITTDASGPVMELAVPAHIVGQIAGTYEIVLSIASADASSRAQMMKLVMVFFIAVVITIMISSFFIVRTVVRPIQVVTKSVAIIGRGDLRERVPIKSSDEIGKLAVAFNEMADQLVALHSGLEQKVKDRSVDLEKKLVELEKMNALMIDRELKMAELKKEIEALKKDHHN